LPRPPFQIGQFVGQGNVLKAVLRRQDGAMSRGEPLPHHLFTGTSGLGKSLATNELAERSGAQVTKFHCQESLEEIVELLQEVKPCDFAFFDEAHRLDNLSQEILYQVIDNLTVPARLLRNAATVESIKIAPLTLIFATDQPGHLKNALLKRIPATVHFQPYPDHEMREIVSRVASRRNLLLSPQASLRLARVCHGIPRRAEHRVNDVRLFFPDSERRQLGLADIEEYLSANGIDGDSLGAYERIYLDFLAENACASLDALAGYLGIDQDYVRKHIEQPLRYRGLIIVRSTGRVLTPAGLERTRSVRQARTNEQQERTGMP
jgi:Holliday junction resolvasome RuvABC ATP-dependent DNA helicase subunit